MIIAKCPIRISLAGGSTDLDPFLQKYGRGAVIGFSANLHTFIMLREDKIGHNKQDNKYVIDYMKREITDSINQINNDVARVSLDYFNIAPITCWFTSDFHSSGSGLAASSAYLNAFIKACSLWTNQKLSNYEICQLSYILEKKFNPLTGYQDPFGCGIGGFKRLDFSVKGEVTLSSLDNLFFKPYDMYIVHTGLSRRSTEVLKTINPDRSLLLLDIVDEMYDAIQNNNHVHFLQMVNDGWKIKKSLSKKIIENSRIIEMDTILEADREILAHRLLGAGDGGYFLFFTRKNVPIQNLENKLGIKILKIDVCNEGISGHVI